MSQSGRRKRTARPTACVYESRGAWWYAIGALTDEKHEEHGPFVDRGEAERALAMDRYYRRAAKRAAAGVSFWWDL